MAKSKRPSRGRPIESSQPAWPGPPIPEELAGLEDLHVRFEAGKPAAYDFSLDFPANLTAIVHSEETGGFSAEVPALPGCFTEGETLEELRENLQEAAEGWLRAHHDLVSADRFRKSLEGLEER